MKKIVFLVLMMPLLSGCFVSGKAVREALPGSDCLNPPDSLPEVTGYTATAIGWGDSYLVVVPISEIRSNTEFRFLLAPEERSDKDADYESAWVTVTGINETTSTTATWLSESKQLSSNIQTMVLCIPELDEGHVYKYSVTITDKDPTDITHKMLGFIDPRAVVIPE